MINGICNSYSYYLKKIQDSGPYLEHRMAGPDKVVIQGLNTGTLDLSANGWGHEVLVLKLQAILKRLLLI